LSKGHDKKSKADHSVNVVEWPWCNKEYQPKWGDFDGFLDCICIFHPQGKRKTWNCDQLQGFIDEVLKTAKGADQERKPEEPKGDFPKVHKEVKYIYGGPNSFESRPKQKLTAREVMAVSPATPECVNWSKVPITLDRSDHPDFVLKPGRYPLIVYPIIKDVKLNWIPINRGSSLNILFLKTFDQMGLSRSLLCPNQAPFHGIVPGAAATPVGQITLPMTFETWENFHADTIHFGVTDFKTTYNAFLGWPTLSKFMAIPHCAYQVLKMPGSCGIISIWGGIMRAFDCNRESSEIADRLLASIEHQELKQALADSHPNPVMPEAKTSKTSI
jgi:hypothetical protein